MLYLSLSSTTAAITERSSSKKKNVNNTSIARLLNFRDSAVIFKSTWHFLVYIKGILWKMIAKLQFSFGFEINFGHKSGFQVTFREQLEPCFSSVSISGLKKVGRSVAARLHAQEISCW